MKNKDKVEDKEKQKDFNEVEYKEWNKNKDKTRRSPETIGEWREQGKTQGWIEGDAQEQDKNEDMNKDDDKTKRHRKD